MLKRSKYRTFRFFLVAVAVAVLLGAGTATADDSRINAGGSSFVFPLMSRWTSDYQKKTGKKINYQSIGSGAGIQQMLVKTLDFGCTDAPMNEEQLAKGKEGGGEVLHVPLIMGAVVPVYNVPGVAAGLNFSGAVLADIFLGKIKKWNDPAIVAANPGVSLPDLDISVVHRSDGSGTSFVFTDFLSKVSPEWKSAVGSATTVSWPTGIGQKGNEGVAGQVSRAEGSIGYVELIYALQNEMTFAAVQNQAGEFVKGSLDSVTAAAQGALKDLPADLRYSITNAPGKGAYPIAGTVWAVLYKNNPGGKGAAIRDFLHWVTHDGQATAAALNYARLPDGVVARVDEKLNSIQAENG